MDYNLINIVIIVPKNIHIKKKYITFNINPLPLILLPSACGNVLLSISPAFVSAGFIILSPISVFSDYCFYNTWWNTLPMLLGIHLTFMRRNLFISFFKLVLSTRAIYFECIHLSCSSNLLNIRLILRSS